MLNSHQLIYENSYFKLLSRLFVRQRREPGEDSKDGARRQEPVVPVQGALGFLVWRETSAPQELNQSLTQGIQSILPPLPLHTVTF